MRKQTPARFARLARLAGTTALAAIAVAGLASQPAAAQQKTLRISAYGIPQGQGNPHTSTGSRPTIWWWAPLYEMPSFMDEKGNTTPYLATSWEAQGKDTWILKLRPNVTFHNGQPFNAEAMAEVINFITSEDGKKFPVYGEMRTMVAARAVDPLTVEIKTSEPDAILIKKLGVLRVVEPKAWKEMGPAEFAKKPVGTGSFRVTNWGVDRVQYAAFDKSWRKPKVDAIEYVGIEETTSRNQAFLSGQVDLALALNLDNKQAVERAGGKLEAFAIPSAWAMPFIVTAPGPHQDVRVRRALNYAVNKQAFIDSLLGGASAVVSQPATQGTSGYQSDIKPYEYDPAKAKQLLAEAGYANGFEITAAITNQGGLGDIYQWVAQDVGKLGVKIQLQEMPIQEFTRRLFKQTPWAATIFGIDYGSSPTIDALRSINSLHSCKFFNAHYCDPDIMPTIDAANQEFDPAKRAQLVAQIMRHYHEQAPAIFLHEVRQYDGVGAKVRNYKPVNMIINYHEIDLAN